MFKIQVFIKRERELKSSNNSNNIHQISAALLNSIFLSLYLYLVCPVCIVCPVCNCGFLSLCISVWESHVYCWSSHRLCAICSNLLFKNRANVHTICVSTWTIFADWLESVHLLRICYAFRSCHSES